MMTTPYDDQIEGIRKAEANRGISAMEDAQLQRLQHKREGWMDRDPELSVDKAVAVKEFCDRLFVKWHDDSMGWSMGIIEDIEDGRAYSEHMGRAFAADKAKGIKDGE